MRRRAIGKTLPDKFFQNDNVIVLEKKTELETEIAEVDLSKKLGDRSRKPHNDL